MNTQLDNSLSKWPKISAGLFQCFNASGSCDNEWIDMIIVEIGQNYNNNQMPCILIHLKNFVFNVMPHSCLYHYIYILIPYTSVGYIKIRKKINLNAHKFSGIIQSCKLSLTLHCHMSYVSKVVFSYSRLWARGFHHAPPLQNYVFLTLRVSRIRNKMWTVKYKYRDSLLIYSSIYSSFVKEPLKHECQMTARPKFCFGIYDLVTVL